MAGMMSGMAVAKGNAAGLGLVNQFLDDAKARGLIRDAIRRESAGTADAAPGQNDFQAQRISEREYWRLDLSVHR
jgi:hypothetical protein